MYQCIEKIFFDYWILKNLVSMTSLIANIVDIWRCWSLLKSIDENLLGKHILNSIETSLANLQIESVAFVNTSWYEQFDNLHYLVACLVLRQVMSLVISRDCSLLGIMLNLPRVVNQICQTALCSDRNTSKKVGNPHMGSATRPHSVLCCSMNLVWHDHWCPLL